MALPPSGATSRSTHLSRLPALLDANGITITSKVVTVSSKKVSILHGDPSGQPSANIHPRPDQKVVEPITQSNCAATQKENRRSPTMEKEEKKVGLKYSSEKKAASGAGARDEERFQENLANGISVESGEGPTKSKRTVFGFGLSDEQQEVLLRIIEERKGVKRDNHLNCGALHPGTQEMKRDERQSGLAYTCTGAQPSEVEADSNMLENGFGKVSCSSLQKYEQYRAKKSHVTKDGNCESQTLERRDVHPSDFETDSNMLENGFGDVSAQNLDKFEQFRVMNCQATEGETWETEKLEREEKQSGSDGACEKEDADGVHESGLEADSNMLENGFGDVSTSNLQRFEQFSVLNCLTREEEDKEVQSLEKDEASEHKFHVLDTQENVDAHSQADCREHTTESTVLQKSRLQELCDVVQSSERHEISPKELLINTFLDEQLRSNFDYLCSQAPFEPVSPIDTCTLEEEKQTGLTDQDSGTKYDEKVDVGFGQEEDELVNTIVDALEGMIDQDDALEVDPASKTVSEIIEAATDRIATNNVIAVETKLADESSDEESVDGNEDLGERADRELIMQKVKEYYGVKAESVDQEDEREAASDSAWEGINQDLANPEQSAKAFQTHDVANRTTCIRENDILHELWEDECMRYLEREPEFRARLQYEVRVILTSPAFETAGRTVPAFNKLYEKRFGKTVKTTGFSSVARLCRSMPQVVQRNLLLEKGKLQIVDTAKNHRIVAGIRSGLRRAVYDILRSHQGLDFEEMEEQCTRVFGQSLSEVLTEHGYHMPSVECMLRDMPDIAYLDEGGSDSHIYLSKRAEDPALTDGLLIRRPDPDRCFLGMGEERRFGCGESSATKLCDVYQLLGEGNFQHSGEGAEMPKSPEGSRMCPVGMAPEELSDLRVLCAAENNSSSYNKEALFNTIEGISPHVRLRLRLLLALHNEGQGVELASIPSIYDNMFSTPLDLTGLGFESIQELAKGWPDIILQKVSQPGWAFPVETPENRRILNTVTTGLRSAVFATLLTRYPEGLRPLELMQCLEETLSGKLWEILEENGYEIDSLERTQEVLSQTGSDFQLADHPELRLLLRDMEDFVRLGCQEDGALVVKLLDGEFPLLDLLDCDVADTTTTEGAPTSATAVQSTLYREEPSKLNFESISDQASLVMKIDANNHEISAFIETAEVSGLTETESATIETDESCTVSKTETFDLQAGEGSSLSATTIVDIKTVEISNLRELPESTVVNQYSVDNTLRVQSKPSSENKEEAVSPLLLSQTIATKEQLPSQELKHETRMIMGSSEYIGKGLSVQEFCEVYRRRTGHHLHLGHYKTVNSLLGSMSDVVVSGPNANVSLLMSSQNLRILAVAKAGLRQVLFWALLKNPGGVWAELLEGWYLDFAGWQLSTTLAIHGYERTRRAPRLPVVQFLEDMADVLRVHPIDPSVYIWAGGYDDPTTYDALLLGLPLDAIQYDPLREEYETTRHLANLGLDAVQTQKDAVVDETWIPVGIAEVDLIPVNVSEGTGRKLATETQDIDTDEEQIEALENAGYSASNSGLEVLQDNTLMTLPIHKTEGDLICDCCEDYPVTDFKESDTKNLEHVNDDTNSEFLQVCEESEVEMRSLSFETDSKESRRVYAVLRCMLTPHEIEQDDRTLTSRSHWIELDGSKLERSPFECFLDKTLLPPSDFLQADSENVNEEPANLSRDATSSSGTCVDAGPTQGCKSGSSKLSQEKLETASEECVEILQGSSELGSKTSGQNTEGTEEEVGLRAEQAFLPAGLEGCVLFGTISAGA